MNMGKSVPERRADAAGIRARRFLWLFMLNHRILRHRNLLIKLLKPTGHVMQKQFNIQQLYVLPTLYLCVLYLLENKQRLVTLTA